MNHWPSITRSGCIFMKSERSVHRIDNRKIEHRRWRRFWVELRGGFLFFYTPESTMPTTQKQNQHELKQVCSLWYSVSPLFKTDLDMKQCGVVPHGFLRIKDLHVDIAYNYTKRKNVLRLAFHSEFDQYLLQFNNAQDMLDWAFQLRNEPRVQSNGIKAKQHSPSNTLSGRRLTIANFVSNVLLDVSTLKKKRSTSFSSFKLV